MILPQFRDLLEFGLFTAAAALFLFLTLAMEAGYLVGRRLVIKRLATTQLDFPHFRRRDIESPRIDLAG